MIEPSLEEPQEIKPKAEKPALVINVQSWATPVVGLLMLLVGLLAGYFVRPVVSPLLNKATSTPTVSAEAATSDTSSSQPGLKDYVVEKVQHFLGDPNAPVTVIEFSDFQ